MPLNCTLKMVKMLSFMLHIFYHNTRKKSKQIIRAKEELNPSPPCLFLPENPWSLVFREETSLIKSILTIWGSPRSGPFLI